MMSTTIDVRNDREETLISIGGMNDEEEKETVIFIGGMTCQSCVHHIESVLTQRTGVKLVRVGLEQKFALICYVPSLTSPASLAAAVVEIGFEASVDDSNTLTATWIVISGMTCQSCVQHIEGMVCNVPGVRSVHVSLTDSLGTVIYDTRQTSAASLCDVINDIGFDAKLLSTTSGNISTVTTVSKSADEFAWLAATRTVVSQQTCEVSIEGMTCSSCVKNIESTISAVAGVGSIRVSLEQKKAIVVFNPSAISAEFVAEKIDDMGFVAAVLVTSQLVQVPSDELTLDQHLPSLHNEVLLNLSSNDKTRHGSSQPSHMVPHADGDDGACGDGKAVEKKCAIRVSGMTCSSCVANIEKHVHTLKGEFFVFMPWFL